MINQINLSLLSKLGIVTVLLLISTSGFCQKVVTAKQVRQQNRIDRLVNKRFGYDSLKYQVGYDSLTRRLVFYVPSSMQNSFVIKINNAQRKTIDSLLLVKTHDSTITEDLRGKYDMLQTRLIDFRTGYEKLISSQELALKGLKLQRAQDSALIFRLRLLDTTKKKVVTSAKVPPDLRGGADKLLSQNFKLKGSYDSLNRSYQALRSEVDSLKKTELPAPPQPIPVSVKQDQNWIKLVIIWSLAFITLLLFWQYFRRNSTMAVFYPCLVLNETADMVFADVYIRDQEATEIRKFEKGPLAEILETQPEGEKVFEVGIISAPGKKEFLFRKGKADVKSIFDKHYEKLNHAE